MWNSLRASPSTSTRLASRRSSCSYAATEVRSAWPSWPSIAPSPSPVDLEQPDELEFGPVVEIAGKTWLASFNPRLSRDLGEFADQESVGFEYAAQVNYRVAKRWSIAALAFGENKALANAAGFNDQSHLFGPGLYLYSRGGAGDAEPGDDREGEGAGGGPAWSLGVGTLSELTDASDDVTLRVTFAVERQ